MADHRMHSTHGTGPSAILMMAADLARFFADLAVHSLALLCAGVAFRGLWSVGGTWPRLLAFPAAYLGLILGFYLAVCGLALLCVRKIEPGTYKLSDPRALRWLVADSAMRLFERSFLRGYVKDFSPPRCVFYRLMGARMGRNFMMGGDAKLVDPWVLEVGKDTLVATLAIVSGHSVEGDSVVIKPVKIGSRVLIGAGSYVLPGTEIGDGAIVGLGSVVLKDTRIPAGEIWAGVPARKIGSVDV